MPKTKYFQWLILSMLIHVGFASGLFFAPSGPKSNNLETIEIQIQDNRLRQQIVDDPDLGQIAEKLSKQARFLSKLNRRVKKQMVARNTGKTQNRQGPTHLPLKNQRPQSPKKKEEQKTLAKSVPKKSKDKFLSKVELSPEDLFGKGKKLEKQTQRESTTSLSRNVVMGGSTAGDYIPNVESGSFTALNTNQFLFYTFFSRVNEQIRFRWISNIRSFRANATVAELNELAKQKQSTGVEIVLNRKGDVLRTNIFKRSDSIKLDRAASEAFRKASPLNNPPEEMVDSDGLIRLKYSFHVEWRPVFVADGK